MQIFKITVDLLVKKFSLRRFHTRLNFYNLQQIKCKVILEENVTSVKIKTMLTL